MCSLFYTFDIRCHFLGRYSYREQPNVVRWNLGRLIDALHVLGVSQEAKERELQVYDDVYQCRYYEKMGLKLGLLLNRHEEGDTSPRASETCALAQASYYPEVCAVVDEYVSLLAKGGVDFTLSFHIVGNSIDCSQIAVNNADLFKQKM